MKKPTEADLVKACLQLLRLRGIFAFRVNCGAVLGTHRGKRRFVRFTSVPGVSDILGVLPGGRLLCVEAKGPKGKLRASQAAFLDAVRRAGCGRGEGE